MSLAASIARRSRGVSLIELIVASAITILLMLEVWGLVRAGGHFYLKVRGQSEIQRETLLAMRWIAKDLSEGSDVSFRQYSVLDADGKATGVEHEGIVFGSPSQSGSDDVAYNDKGRILWSSMIGYFIEPKDRGFYRLQMPLPEPRKTFPPVIDDDLYSTDVLATKAGPRLVARDIESIETTQSPGSILVKLATRNEELGYGIKVQTRLEMKN